MDSSFKFCVLIPVLSLNLTEKILYLHFYTFKDGFGLEKNHIVYIKIFNE